jgi:multicomponent Na+:H+ antiporter subunit G
MISTALDVIGALLLVLGLVLLSMAFIGLLRMHDTYSQLHAQGLATGPGVIALLASSVATEDAGIISFAVLGIAFTVLTSPAAGHAIARAAHNRADRP